MYLPILKKIIYIIFMETKISDKKHLKILNKIKDFTLMDNDFMNAVFQNDTEITSFVLQVILENPTLKVLEVKTQYHIKNIHGRTAILDVKAKDNFGKHYNIEIQRSEKGSGVIRARYYSSLLDGILINPGDDFESLPETYIIFITEKDVFKCGLPVYHIDRIIKETKEPFGDGSHIIYVNGKYRGNSPLGELMHDFHCNNPDDMKNKILAEKTKYFKENEQGVKNMCRAVEELFKEEKIEMIIKMLKKNISETDISEITEISIEEIKKIKETQFIPVTE